MEAQNILQVRITETNDEIRALESEKRKLQGNPGNQTVRRIEDIDHRLDDLYAEKESFEDDYRLVTEPFGIQMVASIMKQQAAGNSLGYSPPAYPRESQNSDNYYETSQEGHTESPDLKFLLYLTLGFGLIEIIMIYGKYDFLNVTVSIIQLIVLTCLLSIYLMNFFDKAYIRLALALLGISIILDIVWLAMEAGSKWNPPEVSNNSEYQKGYMRFIVFFTITLLFVKAAIIFFLFKHRNTTSADKYQISLGLLKIMLDGNKGNPFSKQLTILGQN